MTKYIGKIPEDHLNDDNIKWIIIEPHIEKNEIVGYFMYLHKTPNEDAIWDNWYQTLDIAFDAGEVYGLKRQDWKVLFSN